MGQLLFILMRILFPCDPVARCRELMRVWLSRVMEAALDPEEVESFAYWAEDRAKLEGAICFLEYFMRVLTYGRTRQMLGLQHVHIPLQPQPRIRNPASMAQLFRRLTQLGRDFHNLDALAARHAERIKRAFNNDPLRLDAAHQATSPALCAVEATHLRTLNVQIASLSAQHWGRWIGASSRRDGGGIAFARGPPPIPYSLFPALQLAATCEIAPARP